MFLGICNEANPIEMTESTSCNKSIALTEALANEFIRNKTAGQMFYNSHTFDRAKLLTQSIFWNS